MNQIKNLVFDLGDVLLQFRWRDFLRNLGVKEEDVDRVGAEMFDDPQHLWHEFDLGNLSAQQAAEELGKVLRGIYRAWDGAAYERYIDRLSIPRGKQFKDMSRGNRMKLGIAAALSHGARLLILDEATSGLDPVVRDEVIDILCDFTRDEEHSVLMSSHIVSDLEKACDYIAFLHEGRLLLCEEKDRLCEEYGVAHCTAEELSALAPESVIGRRSTSYGVEALVRRGVAPEGTALSRVSIEELFIFMVKGDR